jgi:hypothetical protein
MEKETTTFEFTTDEINIIFSGLNLINKNLDSSKKDQYKALQTSLSAMAKLENNVQFNEAKQ